MRYLRPFNEQLHISESVESVLRYLIDEYDDKIAYLLQDLEYNEIYSDNEDINFLELSKQLKMFNFRPANRRADEEQENYKEEKSTSMKIGRLVKSIISKVEKYFEVSYEAQGLIYQYDYHWAKNQLNLLLKGNLDFLVLRNDKSSHAKIKFTVDGKQYKAKLLHLQVERLNQTLRGIFGNESVQTTEFYLEYEEDLPIHYKFQDYSLNRVNFEPKDFKIELKSNYDISDKDVEKFVDRAVAYVKLIRSDEDSELKIVEGEKIRNWYLDESYQAIQGELGNSCMAHEECQDYLDIYCANKGIVSLLILVNKKNKLIGRALVWKLRDGRTFMDRAYTILPSDKYVFYNYAKENNWAYRMNELGELSLRYGNEKSKLHDALLEVDLEEWNFKHYPYLDTLNLLDPELGRLSNKKPAGVRKEYWKLTDTGGEYYTLERD